MKKKYRNSLTLDTVLAQTIYVLTDSKSDFEFDLTLEPESVRGLDVATRSRSILVISESAACAENVCCPPTKKKKLNSKEEVDRWLHSRQGNIDQILLEGE